MFKPSSNSSSGSYHKRNPNTSRPHPKTTKPKDDDIVEVTRVLKGYPHKRFWNEYKVNFQRAGWFKHATRGINSLRKLKLGDDGEFVMEMIKGERIVKDVVDFLMKSYQQFLKQHHPELFQNADKPVDDDMEESDDDEYEEDAEEEESEEPNDFQKLTKQMEELTAMVKAQHKEIQRLQASEPESE